MMGKAAVWVAGVAGAVGLAALFGALHDQVTYGISPEYYTALKFLQFHLAPMPDEGALMVHLRVAGVGVLATWWVGAGLGLMLATLNLIQRDAAAMARGLLRGAFWVVAMAALFAVVGYFLWPRLEAAGLQVPMPAGVKDAYAFGRVGLIHDFSYLGGAVGGGLAVLSALATRILRR
jgi:hypothetical protein